MIKRIAIVAGILLAGIVFISTLDPGVQPQKKEVMTMHALFGVLEQMHLRPADVNDDFSREAFADYLEDLDGNKRFFIQPEVDELKSFELKLDDQIRERSLGFFDRSLELLNNAIDRGEVIYREMIDYDFDLSKEEYFELDGDKRLFAQNEDELRDYWRKILKYQILTDVERDLEKQKDKPAEEQIQLDSLIEKAREDTRENFDLWFERMGELRRSDRFEIYLNAFAQLYDPHTGYFSPKEKEEFDIRMGGKLEGIGARLTREDDYIKVTSIVPGGPAWKGKELEVGDFIVKVTQKGEEEGVDIVGYRVDDAVQLIRGNKGTVVILQVKKKDGSLKDIEIERDEVVIDAAFARSVIFDLDNQVDRIGYIKLPMFYSTFDGGRSCAEDVAIELEKLKAEKVNGIILDLRYNGGGSLPDVIEMSGLFIEEGPIVQVKSREQKPEVYRDQDEKVVYDGPLIVMVNSISASASEILAAALQDYGRAIIIGGDATFGKGTVQRFLDLDRVIRGQSDQKPLGQVKLTMQQFYRVNGGSTQLRGVVPDIILPDQYAYVEVGEKEYETALEWTEIEPTQYEQDVYKLPDLGKLRSLSQERVDQDSTFVLIREQGSTMKQMRDESYMPLQLDALATLLDQREQRMDQYDGIMKDTIPGMFIHTLDADQAYLQTDSSRIARHEDWVSQMKKDVYIREGLMIMKDLLQYDPRFAEH